MIQNLAMLLHEMKHAGHIIVVIAHLALIQFLEVHIHSNVCRWIHSLVNKVKHGAVMALNLAIRIHIGKQILVHKQIIHAINRQHILNGFDDNVVVDYLVKAGPVLQVCCREKSAGKIRVLPNWIIRFKILVEQSMPGALDVMQFGIMVLLQQIIRAGDIAVDKPLNRDVYNGPEI